MTRADTIFALSSGAGRAGIAVIRLSGDAAGRALEELSGRDLPPARQATRMTFFEGDGEQALDHGIALWFPQPASYTGEDVCELHVHGGRAVVAAVLERLGALDGLRPAEPGEFSRRAFINGKMDLTAAEGLADLIMADTEAQRRQALRQFDGALAAILDGWRARLIRALAHLEAAVDFADEELPEGLTRGAADTAHLVAAEMRVHLDDERRGERLREGFHIAVIGPPNAGKSSLVNGLARREAAIVSTTAGTTRDIVEVHLDLRGVPVTIADTAGLRAGREAVEREGVRRARVRAGAADLRIGVFDASTGFDPDKETLDILAPPSLIVLNKIDLITGACPEIIDGRDAVSVSCKTGYGLAQVLERIADHARNWVSDGPVLTRARHRTALADCVDALDRAQGAAGPELVAEEFRTAARALGRVTGRVDVEDILDVIFADFCLGK